MIRIEKLTKSFGRVTALDGIDLSVASGELFGYLGPNGAGKTTTIRILTGLTRLGSGSAVLNGHDIEKQPLDAKKQYGLVPQHINLDSELTVYENLYVHGRLHHMARGAIKTRIDELLAYIELNDKRHTLANKLSGGMKRRVMIARALLHAPKILFLDEPTVGLDPGIRRRIWALIKKIQQDGVTIFLTTHYIEEAEFLAQRVAFFIFSSLAVGLAMLVKSHADQATMNSFVITPMAFLGGTFFPIEKLPVGVQKILLLLPLTHAADAIRSAAFGTTPRISDYLILAGIGVITFVFAMLVVGKARD